MCWFNHQIHCRVYRYVFWKLSVSTLSDEKPMLNTDCTWIIYLPIVMMDYLWYTFELPAWIVKFCISGLIRTWSTLWCNLSLLLHAFQSMLNIWCQFLNIQHRYQFSNYIPKQEFWIQPFCLWYHAIDVCEFAYLLFAYLCILL